MKFSDQISTSICYEQPSKVNPFVAEESYIHGYNLTELQKQRSFTETFFLLFRGELPDENQSQLLNTLMIGMINPGPRHPASRAAMTAAISKADPAHVLPIGLMTLGGAHLGANEAYQSACFLQKNGNATPEIIFLELMSQKQSAEGDIHIAPGFGSRFGAIDPIPNRLANLLASLPAAGEMLQWASSFVTYLQKEEMGWLTPGVAAAALLDLGFHQREIPGLFQLFAAPGILAHGVEQSFKPVTEMPFIKNEQYEYKK